MKYPIKIGIIGGSGLDDPRFFEHVSKKTVITPFGCPSDELMEGEINGIPCVMLPRHGKKHNIPPSKVNYRANIWALKEVGCTHVLVSSACGSLQEKIKPGTVVVPDSFIDLTKHRDLTFYNCNEPHPDKVVHIPMEPAFCSKTRQLLLESAQKLNIFAEKKGTVIVIEGPRFSTLAESNVYRSWNADLINMTLAPEAVLAKEVGLCYACVALATDYDCWHHQAEKVSVSVVVKTFQENMKKVKEILLMTINAIKQENWDDIIDENKAVIENAVQSEH